jgi:ADP-heptose:LPS heptosyltransferase
MNIPLKRIGLLLTCEGMGDCLYAIAVIKKLYSRFKHQNCFDVFTHHPVLFQRCPYVDKVYSIKDQAQLGSYRFEMLKLFEPDKLQHWTMDTYDFISIPLGLGELSFREKQLEYFPTEEDRAASFDVVLSTSITWPSRSWPAESWQRLADELVQKGKTVAVVGKDVQSVADQMHKRSPVLQRCTNLINQLSLDQTYYTIRKSKLFVSCQNGLSVLSGATDTEVVVLDMSIEWSKRAIYRNENPHYKATYVKGDCSLYCCESMRCPVPENRGQFKCIPSYERVEKVVLEKAGLA